MKSKIEFLLKQICPENADEITVSEESSIATKTYFVDAPDECKPIIIGKHGKTIKAIYNLLNPYAKKERIYNYQIKIKD